MGVAVEINKIYNEDCLETLKKIDNDSIDCVITSPPYYQLRDYGWTGQWGLEKTYQEYLDKLISLMSGLKRVLKPTGTMWINLGDSYSTISGGTRGLVRSDKQYGAISHKAVIGQGFNQIKQEDYPKKSLMLIPHRFAIRCVDELGLILRNDVIWVKRNGMPESVTDRFSKKHEFFFFFVKQQKYYFDLERIKGKHCQSSLQRALYSYNKEGVNPPITRNAINPKTEKETRERVLSGQGKNPGDVSDFWDIPTQGSPDKHYATYNFDLIDKPIIAGCPKDGVILDPFCGTGTTIARAIQLGRNGIGIDGKQEYCDIANKRIENELKQLKLAI